MSEEYLVPTGYGEAELIEKRSRFIGRIWRCETEAEALAALEQIRQQHWDASHNVYAYCIHGGATRFSDDGEPGGTAGMPVLEVLRRNTNATQAYAGVGRALLKENRYDEALEYFKLGDSREEYSQAYRIVRLNVIRDNAPWVVCAVVVAVILFKLLGLLLRKLGWKKGMIADFGGRLLDKVHLSRNTVFPKVLFHPFDGFNQIRFGGSVALWPSVIILVLYVIATIYQFVGTGCLFNQNNIADINLWLLLAKSLGVVALFIVAQWSMAILTNGSGRFKDIIVTACYSQAPYTVGLLVGTWLSNFIIMDEMYAEYIILIGLAWSAMLLLIGTMVIHELPFARALGFLALTVAAMAVILFVLVLFYTLLMQLRTFGYTLYVELVFRM